MDIRGEIIKFYRDLWGEKAGKGILHRGSSNTRPGAEPWSRRLETFLELLGSQACLKAVAESYEPASLLFKVDKIRMALQT